MPDTEIMLTGWRPGFQKIAHTNLMRRELGLSLKAAKDITDALLDGKVVRLEMPSGGGARLTELIEACGAIVSTGGLAGTPDLEVRAQSEGMTS